MATRNQGLPAMWQPLVVVFVLSQQQQGQQGHQAKGEEDQTK